MSIINFFIFINIIFFIIIIVITINMFVINYSVKELFYVYKTLRGNYFD